MYINNTNMNSNCWLERVHMFCASAMQARTLCQGMNHSFGLLKANVFWMEFQAMRLYKLDHRTPNRLRLWHVVSIMPVTFSQTCSLVCVWEHHLRLTLKCLNSTIATLQVMVILSVMYYHAYFILWIWYNQTKQSETRPGDLTKQTKRIIRSYNTI